jgi:hypothetical protein
MKAKQVILIGLAGLSLLAAAGVAQLGLGGARRAEGQGAALVDTVRSATERYKSLDAAKAAGYGLFHGCVSGPQAGSMGVHFVNGDLVGDGALDAMRPEALIYEMQNGRMELVGVEYVVIAEAWHAKNEGPPVLMGQLFHYNGSPNRYGIPAFYELHVWAWKANPNGTFADWHPNVSCDDIAATAGLHRSGH